ncbi:MAG: N-acetylmuramoyl-L-alanine amidase [Deltaproteobacteria bacterium]|nr:N-acetylmuramoyl-L-alanine amidase [Deltaproteobacteria bacterium]
MRARSRFVLPLLAVLLGSCSNGPVDPATFASAVTLDDAITRASVAYEVPRDLLAAVAWSETRFGNPVVADDHEHPADREADRESHGQPELGPLHLRATGTLDTVSRARALLGVGEEALRSNTGLGVAGAAAVLAELGAQTGADPDDLATWAEAVARYSGLRDRVMQVSYASQVFATLRSGVTERSFTGERIRLAAHPSLPAAEERLGVRQAVSESADYGPARWVPASTSNYTRGRSGGSIQYVVIHTMQGSYAGSTSWFQNPAAGASAHYNIRSSDGEITQMVAHGDTAWHAGNWNINQRSIGIEHEGYVADPGRWYTERMYVASARLTRALCDRYGIPIDRAHIIGHYQVPRSGSGAPCSTSATNCGGAGGHTDPGNGGGGWNWSHYLDLVRGGGSVTPPPPPPPATPAYAATFVGASCPTAATSGDRPVAWFEFRNTGTATWAAGSTRLGTTGPRDHNGVFFDMENWVARNRPSGVDRATAPGAVGRFSFVLGIPGGHRRHHPRRDLRPGAGGRRLVRRRDLRAMLRPGEPPRRAPASGGRRRQPGARRRPPGDARRRREPAMPGEPVDAGSPEPIDAGSPEPIDAGGEPPTGDDAGVLGDELAEVSGSLDGGCSTAPSSGGAGVRGGLCLAALALVASARRRRRA